MPQLPRLAELLPLGDLPGGSMHTTALPAGGLYRRATTRRTPAILAGFLDAYRAEHQCSRKAAAWELRETFAELAAWAVKHDRIAALGPRACWVGTVADPATPRGPYKIGAHQLAAYFERNMLADGAPVEFVECSTLKGEPHTVSDAAVAFDPEELAHLLALIDRPVPAFLMRDPAPAGEQMPTGCEERPMKGARLGTFRKFVHGLLEIAANAACRDREEDFCKTAATLADGLPMNTTASALLELAKQARIEDFPSRNTIKDYL